MFLSEEGISWEKKAIGMNANKFHCKLGVGREIQRSPVNQAKQFGRGINMHFLKLGSYLLQNI